MRRRLLMIMLGLGGCASSLPQNAPPDARAVARIETGIAALEDIQSVGVGDSAGMARAAQTRVRDLRCGPAEAGRFQCGYRTARRIARGEWTLRTRTFERVRQPSPGQPQAGGWVVVKPEPR